MIQQPPISKDDTASPSFVPLKCPVCFECIWERDQLVFCKECNGSVCALCCHSMISHEAKLGKTASCPLCREANFIPSSDIETGRVPSDRDSLLFPSRLRDRDRTPRRRNSSRCSARNGTRVALATILGALIYIFIHAQ